MLVMCCDVGGGDDVDDGVGWIEGGEGGGDEDVGLGWIEGGGEGWQSRKLRRDRRPRLAGMGQKWSMAQITIMVDGTKYQNGQKQEMKSSTLTF